MNNFATGCSMMFRARLLKQALPFPSQLQLHDHWIALLAAARAGGGISVIRHSLTKYRQHQRNLIGSRQSKRRNLLGMMCQSIKLVKSDQFWESAIRHCKKQQLRIRTFLERSELWTRSEIKIMKKLERAYSALLPESGYSTLAKVRTLPSLLYSSLYTRERLKTAFIFIALTFLNRKSCPQ
jgi:hypothetical protein